jgi:hypothetical protein
VDRHYFGKSNLDPNPHESEKLDPDPHESQNSDAIDAQNGTKEGLGHSQMDARRLNMSRGGFVDK